MSARDDMVAFDRKLRKLIGKSDERPFLCQGSPFGCEIFLVGINPKTDTPFRDYWKVENGCNKEAWLKAYLQKHGSFGPTRARILILCTVAENGCDEGAWLKANLQKHDRFGPKRERILRLCRALEQNLNGRDDRLRVLETNIFHRRSDSEAKLAKSDRTTDVFEFLLKEVRPRILFVHGGPAVAHLERLTRTSIPRGEFTPVCYQDVSFEVFAGHHLSRNWSYEAVKDLGNTLRKRCITLRERCSGSHVI